MGAAVDGEAGGEQISGVKHRRDMEINILFDDIHRIDDLPAIGKNIAVSEQDAFTTPCRTAGIEHKSQIIFIWVLRLSRVSRVEQIVHSRHIFIWRGRTNGYSFIPPRCQLFIVGEAQIVITECQQLALRIFENMKNFRRCETMVDRYGNGASPKAGIHQLRITERIWSNNAETVTFLDA